VERGKTQKKEGIEKKEGPGCSRLPLLRLGIALVNCAGEREKGGIKHGGEG